MCLVLCCSRVMPGNGLSGASGGIGELSLLVAAGLLAYLLGLGLAGLRPRHLRH